MRAVILGVNASFSHTSLALRYLTAACRQAGVAVDAVEANINERAETIALRLLELEPAILLCSVYIWNRRLVEDVCVRLYTALPELIVVWGGPEGCTDCEELFSTLPYLSYLCLGEGEEVLPLLLTALRTGQAPTYAGIYSREGPGFGVAEVCHLDELADPYGQDEGSSPHKLYYFETSRGCPYSCAYCLSAGSGAVRYMSLDLAKRRLADLSSQVRIIKFVDRTFNADPARARELWKFLMELPGSCRFHFEVCAHLLSEEDFALLDNPKAQRFQFEIGLQSASLPTLARIGRQMNPGRILAGVARLMSQRVVEVHLDLICGLPGEGVDEFWRSLEAALSVFPDRLHLGFLKVLPGSKLASLTRAKGYGVLPYAPYEVLRTPVMSPQDFLAVKKAEHALERFYNSRGGRGAVTYALAHIPPKELFLLLAEKESREGTPEEALYSALSDKVPSSALFRELCLFDFLLQEPHKVAPPSLILGQDEEGRMLRGIVYGDKEVFFNILPHRRLERPGVVLRNLRLGVFSPATLAHLGLQGGGKVVFDHSLPLCERAIAVPEHLG